MPAPVPTPSHATHTRTHNAANEIGSFTTTGGTTLVNPVHDAAGNMTFIPQPLAMNKGYNSTYDAWNRPLRHVDAPTGQTVALYRYDGRGRRTVKETYTAGTLSETRHFYYSNDWQVLEERLGTSTSPERQHIWGLTYIDEMVCRYRDTDANGSLDETLYAVFGPQYTITAIVNTSGSVAERYTLTPYGMRVALEADFSLDPDWKTDLSWHHGHQGLMHDPETGMIYNKNRYLHEGLGRFTTRDPLGYVDGVSLYEYVRSNPVRYTDPSGGVAITSIEGAIEACLRQPTVAARIACLEDLFDLEGLTDAMNKAIREAIDALIRAKAIPCPSRNDCTPEEYAELTQAVDDACNKI